MAKQKRPDVRLIYQEIYTRPGLLVQATYNPELKHVTKPFTVVKCYVTKAGSVEIEGVRHEFQDLRVYLKEG